jgi:hypothetical protein
MSSKAYFTRLIYGVWITRDGSEVMFSRSYHPLWIRKPGQPAAADDWDRWVDDIVGYVYLYNDRSFRDVHKQLRRIKQDFIEGRVISTTQTAQSK